MAKRMFLNSDDIERFLNEAKELLCEMKGSRIDDSKIGLAFKMTEVTEKAKLIFSQKAWIKMFALVNYNQKEIGWHGTVTRLNNNSYRVEDIYVFPQEVTGASVTPDRGEYDDWCDSLDEDVQNALRFHGHSHVNMGISPSATDTTFRKDMLNNFRKKIDGIDWLYIFLIANKSGDFNIQIFDMENNIVYETNDVEVIVELGDGEILSEFIEEANKSVKTRTYTQTTFGQGTKSTGYYGAYGGSSYGKNYGGYSSHETSKKSKKKEIPVSAVDDVPDEEELKEIYGEYYDKYYGGY